MLSNPAFWSAVVAVVTAVTALVKQVQHQNSPQHSRPVPPKP